MAVLPNLTFKGKFDSEQINVIFLTFKSHSSKSIVHETFSLGK
jgi:hypothetical protein